MIDIESTILTALITGFFSILGTWYIQKSITRRNNQKFLKDTGWDPLMKLVSSVTNLMTSVETAEQKTIEELNYNDVSIDDIRECHKVMKESKPFIYITGERKILRSFGELLYWLEELIKHSEKPQYLMVYRMEIEKLTVPSAELIREISAFLHS